MKLLILSCLLSIALATPVRRSASSSGELRGGPLIMAPPQLPPQPNFPQQPPQPNYPPQIIPIPIPYDPAQGSPVPAGPFPFPFPSYPGPFPFPGFPMLAYPPVMGK